MAFVLDPETYFTDTVCKRLKMIGPVLWMSTTAALMALGMKRVLRHGWVLQRCR
jgi:hypothetical protein